MSADLRDLLERTAAAPTAPVDPARIATWSRRRTRRWRGGAGATAVALVALLAVVAWPGAGPGGLVIDDRAADQPTAPVLDLPEGWVQVQVGDATFGVPTDLGTPEFDLDTFELAPSDGPPCHNGLDRVRAYLAPDGYPMGVVQDRDPGGVLHRPEPVPEMFGFCRAPLALYTSLLAAPLSTVPELVREQRHAPHLEPAPRPTAVTLPSGIHGQRIRVGGRLEAYAFPQVDLWLEFHNVERDPDLIEQVLATVTTIERR